MKCSKCGSEVKKGWQFCPECGAPVSMDFNELFNSVFSNLLKKLDENPEFMKKIEDMSRQLEKNMETIDIKPAFSGKPVVRRSGFTINIRTQTGKKPKVDIRTFGTAGRKGTWKKLPIGKHIHVRHGKLTKHPETTSEPRAISRRVPHGVEVEIDLPGVRPKDIEVNDLNNSIEVKAAAGRKGFFRIIKKPYGTMVRGHRFSKGKLKLLIA